MEKTKHEPFSMRGSISKIFSFLAISTKKSGKDGNNKKPNKSKTALEYVIDTYTEYRIEDYYIHSKIYLEYDDVDAFIIILSDCILITFIIEDDIIKVSCDPIISKIEYTQIYNFDLIVSNEDFNSIIFLYFEESISNKIQSKINFNYNHDSFLIHHFIKKNYILTWQKKFEEKILKDALSEIYQYHFYVKKINNRGKNQERILMLSNKVILYYLK